MKVTYDGNGFTGGTVPVDSTDYDAGDYATVKAPGTMVKDGAKFAGWKSLANTKTYYPRNKLMVHRSTTLEALWDPASVINYDMLNALNIEGIPPLDTRRYYIGDKVTIPPHDNLTALQAIVGEGDDRRIEGLVSLQGWKIITGATAARPVLRAGDTFMVTGGMVVLQAVWAADEISIAYEINGAEGDTPEIQTAQSGRKATLAVPTCTKAGYYFDGWRDMITDEVYEAGKEAAFMGCTTLEAVWRPLDEYTVHYDGNDASGGEPPADERLYHGDCVFLPKPSEMGGIYKTGYTFTGWVLREPQFLFFEAYAAFPVTQNTTFYARWMPDDESLRRHVTYVSDETDIVIDGEPPTDSIDYVDGDFAAAKTWSPFKPGRMVTGWELDGTVYQFGDFVPIQGDITLTAVWKSISPVTLTFSGGAGAEGTVNDIVCSCTGTVMLPLATAFSREGYFADGWVTPDGEKFASGTEVHVNLTGDPVVLEYAVNWIDTTPEHTVTYFSIGHDSGHVPVDLCKYHAGDIIPLAPAGDLRKDGFELAAWDDVTTGKTYSIPTNEKIIAYCTDSNRPECDSAFPMMWCTGNHMLRAHWVPVAQLFFGSMGATSGLPPDPMRVRYGETVRIPDKGTLNKNGYTLVGWKDEITGVIYKVGDLYECVASETLVLQPVLQTSNIVEYIIPQGLNIVNAGWMPKNSYCVNCHSKQVIVPPEMEGKYCWVRSDTGERITETCEIHDIYGDICLTLTPLNMSTDGDDRWVWSTQAVAEGLTPMPASGHRCGDYFEFPKNSGAGFSGWILNNDERRVYQPGERVQIFGHAVLRAVYPNATHTVTFSYPEGTLAVPPDDTAALAEGTLYQLPPGDGIRGPNGTKLLYWYGVNQTSSSDDPPIIRKWYPGEYLRVPLTRTDLDADGKMLNTDGELVVYPQFGNKFMVEFADAAGAIMPASGVTAPGVYAEYQVVRTPQITKLDRSAHTDVEWKAAWRMPYRAESANAYTYAGMFEADEEEGNGIITNMLLCVVFGWLFCIALKVNQAKIEDRIRSVVKKYNLPLETTLVYVYDESKTTELKPLPTEVKGMWFDTVKLVNLADYLMQDAMVPVGWTYAGEQSLGVVAWLLRFFGVDHTVRLVKKQTEPVIFGAPGTCRWEATFTPSIIQRFYLTDSMEVYNDEIVHDARSTYEYAMQPKWVNPKYVGGMACRMDTLFIRPVGGMDFTYYDPFASIVRRIKAAFIGWDKVDAPRIYDRWYPRVFNADTGQYELNPNLKNYDSVNAENELWLDANGYVDDPRRTVGPTKRRLVPDPRPPTDSRRPDFSMYFQKVHCQLVHTHSGNNHHYLITFDLRWARPEYVEYTYFRGYANGEHVKQYYDKIVGEPTRHRTFHPPGSYPQVAVTGDLPNFTSYFHQGDVQYSFDHWEIRKDSDMYRYYTEKGIADRDKEYTASMSLPQVTLDQPSMYLYLDAIYTENYEPDPQPDDEVDLYEYGDDTMFPVHQRLLANQKREDAKPSLDHINAFSVYQQNEANARKASGGILSKFITGVKVVAGVALAAASIFAIASHLKSRAQEARGEFDLNERAEFIEPELGFGADEGFVNNAERNRLAILNRNYQDLGDSFESRGSDGEFYHNAFNAGKAHGLTDEVNRLEQLPNIADKLTKREMKQHQSHRNEVRERDEFEKLVEENDRPVRRVQPVIKPDPHSINDYAMEEEEEQLISNLDPRRMNVNEGRRTMSRKQADLGASRFTSLTMSFEPEIREGGSFSGFGLTGTPSPHQLTENAAEYAYIKYVPRDPDDPNWYQIGDTIHLEEGEVPVITHYLTFANAYDDNAPDSETHTVDETYYEPHETVTVEECAAEAPEDMEFAGWILDEDTTTRSVVQPGDTLTQGLCNHKFKALWLPANPTRFPHLQTPTPIVPNPSEEAKLNPVPVFPEPTEEEVN